MDEWMRPDTDGWEIYLLSSFRHTETASHLFHYIPILPILHVHVCRSMYLLQF